MKETFFIRKIEVPLSGLHNLLWMKGGVEVWNKSIGESRIELRCCNLKYIWFFWVGEVQLIECSVHCSSDKGSQ